ncbi:hypothetical protein [Nocardioides acrostichi]|uniref:7-cyano-7-deazaguanine synthase n=1 Tax=Nocardioides acrostichi TaxID=2784339 RepID=A0A930UZ24_9ACTN|nr:hypothetical protein [Nocardioides acrostichi]MBF4161024.1 hypothetical protein [Nocardioides acrostichi]
MNTTAADNPTQHHLSISSPVIDKGHVKYTLDGTSHQASAKIKTLTAGLPSVDTPAVELFLAATAAWLADRSIPRNGQPDRWKRHINIAFPVTNPTTWPSAQTERLLRFLSNDHWTVTPYQATQQPTLSPSQLPLIALEADAVDLFSGGLDSYAFAAANPENNRLAVGHWDMGPLKGLQERLHDDLGRSPDRLRWFHVAVKESTEDTSRTRGFLFAAAAVAVAATLRAPTVTIPENGFVALNVPLTASRTGALSTRSTHPHTLTLIGNVIQALGIDVQLDNPWLYSTKGDITRAALTQLGGIAATVSCSHPTERWRGDATYSNCGYCYPCLVRRSGIEAATGGTDPTTYKFDPRTDVDITNPKTDRRADIYAVIARLASDPHPRDLVRTAPLPPDVDRERLQDMRERSHRELRTMLDNGMTAQVRRNLGL